MLSALLRASEVVTRTSLAASTGLSAATVSRVMDGLIQEGWVAEGATVNSGRIGRSAVSLHVQAARGVVVGVDLGGTNCRVVVADLLGAPLRHATVPTPSKLDAHDLANWVADLVADLRIRSGDAPMHAVAVGLPGVVAPGGAVIAAAPNLPQIEGETLVARLRERLAVPLTLENDSNLALLGEMSFGAARGLHTVVMLTVGTGLGAGVAVDGRLLSGRNGLVGEFGSVPIGADGSSLESLVSGAGLVAQARESGLTIRGADALFGTDALPQARRILRRFRHALLTLLTMSTAAYDPEAVIVGGGLAPAIDAELDRIRNIMRTTLPVTPRLAVSMLGDLAGALGGVVAACQLAYLGLGVDEADLAGLPAPLLLNGLLEPDSLKENSVPVPSA